MRPAAKALLVVAVTLAGIARSGAAETKTNATWERLKSLQGDWEGDYLEGTEKRLPG